MREHTNLTNIEFVGRHAVILEKLSVTQENTNSLDYKKAPLFNRVLDTMFVAGLLGVLCKKKSVKEKNGSQKITIFSETRYNNMNDINFYTAIPIIKDRDLSKIEEVKRALFSEGEEDYVKQRFDIFYSYVLGGLDILDKEVIKKCEETTELESDMDIFSTFENFLSSIVTVDDFEVENFELEYDICD